MEVCNNNDIAVSLGKLANGEMSLREAKVFLGQAEAILTDDALEAVIHYVNDANIRQRDTRYELWTRLDLLDAYISYTSGEKFSVRQYVRYLTRKLKGNFYSGATASSVFFSIKRMSLFYVWILRLEFFLGNATVAVRKGSRWCRSKSEKRQLYEGLWTDMNFSTLSRVIMDS